MGEQKVFLKEAVAIAAAFIFKLCLEVHILAEWFVLKEYNFINVKTQ
ncbi:MAG: hypothetical protein ACLS67_17555 [Anaerobutyricum soehngenii]